MQISSGRDQARGDKGEILPQMGPREEWESPLKFF